MKTWGGGVKNIKIEELRDLSSSKKLVPGQLYRIIDYERLFIYEKYQCQHPFDIILLALDEETLDENAIAIERDGDEYFSKNNCRLREWEIKFYLSNIGSITYSKITYMKDEHGNVCHYDFKNVKIFNQKLNNFVYTFGDATDDYSVTKTSYAFNNVVGKNCRNIFFEGDCKNNIVGDDCKDITFHNSINNIIKQNCENIVIKSSDGNVVDYETKKCTISDASLNKIGAKCSEIKIDQSWQNNIGNKCMDINLFSNSYNNTIGCDCNNLKIVYYSSNNYFDNKCKHIYFGRNEINNSHFYGQCNNLHFTSVGKIYNLFVYSLKNISNMNEYLTNETSNRNDMQCTYIGYNTSGDIKTLNIFDLAK